MGRVGLSHLISIVGAGPGDPGLLTVKARERLIRADVILYDSLMGEEILEFANSASLKIGVGKLFNDGQDNKTRQDEIHAYFLKYSKQNKRVVRLKAGDPMIYGRGAEEIRFCRNNNLNYEVIPGITAGIAAASFAGIPLTERGKSGMILFYTGHRTNGSYTDLKPVATILKTGSPVVVYMGLNNLPGLVNALICEDIDLSTPVRILSKVSQKNQKVFSTSIGAVSVLLKEQNPQTPSVVIIGKYVESV